MIDFYSFTWEAFATLFAGIAAVVGAVYVGVRQVGISRAQKDIAGRQTEILAKQVGLDELKLRAELFDKRFAVYEATRAMIGATLALAQEPEREIELAFRVAKDQATFLFQPSVSEGLQEIWKKLNSFFALNSVMSQSYRTQGHYGDGNSERERELLTWLADRQANLSELFGDELRLTHGALLSQQATPQ